MTGIMEKLREETRAQHEKLETTAFFRALEAGTLELASYVGWLRVLHTLHETLEGELSRTEDLTVRAVWRDDERRTPWLEQDLLHFSTQNLPEASRAQLEAILLSQELRHRARHHPATLLGALYVLEGSALGGQVLRQRVRKAFALSDAAGLTYLTGRGAGTAAHFKAFSARMNEAVTDPVLMQRIVAAAADLFVGLERILSALHPLLEEHVSDMVKVLNLEAGHHDITGDLGEIEIALRVGETSWQAFPYYEARYGERGRRFTRSDSAWLVTLCRLEAAQVTRHVRWLSNVLAARGMPRLMLEEHLLRLYHALCDALPARKERYLPLFAAHSLLREARVSRLPDASLHKLSRDFDAKLSDGNPLPRLGELLAAAVADEADDVACAVSSLSDWLTMDGRFSASFVRAVRASLSTARAAAAKAQP